MVSAPRAALVGTGFMGPIHVEALRRIGVQVIGVLGSSAESSRRAAQAMGIAEAYDGYDDLLADARVDAVHLTVPNRLHFPMARAALAAGKHVLCEKPLAMTSDESAALVQLAADSGRSAGVAYNVRFYPLMIEARERIARNEIGKVLSVTGSYTQDWLLYATDYNWRVRAEDGGRLRAVADIGTHWLDLVQHVCGLRVAAVCADLATFHPVRHRSRAPRATYARDAEGGTEAIPVDTEDAASVLLRFGGGARGSMFVSQAAAGRKNCIQVEIWGTDGSLAWNSEAPETLWLGHRTRPNQLLVRDPALMTPAAARGADYPGGHVEGYADTFKQCFRAFYDHVRGDAVPRHPTFLDGHRALVLCDAILRSGRERTWQDVAEDRP